VALVETALGETDGSVPACGSEQAAVALSTSAARRAFPRVTAHRIRTSRAAEKRPIALSTESVDKAGDERLCRDLPDTVP
jgi:hypothetical protein